jgi:hypothetical protein
MRATRDELPVMLEAGPSSIRGADWGELRVVVLSVTAGTDFGPLLKGLQDNLCQGPHWGYVLKGRLRIRYADGAEEVLSGGDFYYLPPGHTGVAEVDTDFMEVVPPDKHQEFLDNALHNIQTMQQEAAAR